MAISLASEVCLGFLENKYRAKTAAQLGVLLQNAYPAQYLKYEDTVLYCTVLHTTVLFVVSRTSSSFNSHIGHSMNLAFPKASKQCTE